jgi:hypothetical protein
VEAFYASKGWNASRVVEFLRQCGSPAAPAPVTADGCQETQHALRVQLCRETERADQEQIAATKYAKRIFDLEQETARLAGELAAWKREAISVMPDYQKLGKLLNMPLGSSVSAQLVPAVEKLLRERDEAREAHQQTTALWAKETDALEAALTAERAKVEQGERLVCELDNRISNAEAAATELREQLGMQKKEADRIRLDLVSEQINHRVTTEDQDRALAVARCLFYSLKFFKSRWDGKSGPAAEAHLALDAFEKAEAIIDQHRSARGGRRTEGENLSSPNKT